MYNQPSRRPHITVPRQSIRPPRDENGGRAGVYIPPNYSGTAMMAEITPTPHFEHLPQVSRLPSSASEMPETEETVDMEETVAPLDVEEVTDAKPETATRQDTVFRWGDFLNPKHFPWGHGIGKEELFLLGLLGLLLYENSGRDGGGDDLSLTLLLIGALLFCG